MFKAYIASLRLAIALVCLGVSLIIGGICVGLFPNESAFAEQERRQKCDAISLTAAWLVRDQQWESLSQILHLMVDQDRDLVGIEIDTELQHLAVSCRTATNESHSSDQPESRSEPIGAVHDLPRSQALKLDRIVYGDIKFYHRPPETGWLMLTHHPLMRLLAFFVVAGVGVYTVFVIRVMRTFEVTQIVPDRVRQALDTLSEGLLVMDECERIVLANRSFSTMVGLSQEKLVGRRAGSLSWVCSSLAQSSDYPWVRATNNAQPQTEQLMRYQLPDGSFRFFSINCSRIESSQSQLPGALATFRDVTAVEEHRAELEHMLALLRNSRDEISSKNRELEILATKDTLTGCWNRRALFQELETAWRGARQNHTPLACLMVDNDHFKNVNDTYGHQVGDEVLRKVSQVLTHSFHPPAMVCRYGGEEFCVILPGMTLEHARHQAETARANIERIRMGDQKELRLTVSIGVAESQLGANEPQELINQADKCLYVAKGNGRNQVVVFSDSIDEMLIEQTASCRQTDAPRADAIPAETTGLPFQAVTALVSALAFRDSETAEHSRRVADLCVRLGSGFLDQRSTYILDHDTSDAVPKQTAMQIGLQIERLADALDSRDVDGLQTLASRLGAMARHHRIESIAIVAEKIEADAAQENMQWINLLRDTQMLLNLCRATQNAFLADNTGKVDEASASG